MDGLATQRIDDVSTEGLATVGSPPPVIAARRVAAAATQRAAAQDHDGAFPVEEVRHLGVCGLLTAPFPPSLGGLGIAFGTPRVLQPVLTEVGTGNLALGRLYEGHVNAVGLVARYGNAANLKLLRDDTGATAPTGVWMAGEPLRLVQQTDGALVLRGRKILCSGAGFVRRPLVAADYDGGSIMLIPRLPDECRVDTSGWISQGMRATATGTVDFDGIEIGPDEIVGAPGDYMRPPFFRGGAWRVIAVQLGGLEAVLATYKDQLRTSPHRDHPLQLARFGEAAIACETARLWVRQAADKAEGSFDNADEVDAYVDLARNAFEDAALQVVQLAQKAIGLKAFMRPNPMERLVRDLTTYLRQPALDVSLMSAASFHLSRRAGPRP